MIVSHAIQPFRRFGLEVNESIWIGDMPYFNATAIADMLELKDRDDAVTQIVRRSPYIQKYSKTIDVIIEEYVEPENQKKCRPVNLTGQCPLKSPEMAEVLKLMGGEIDETLHQCIEQVTPKKRHRKIKLTVFDPIGLQLIIMESRTRKAQKYKEAVAQVIWATLKGKLYQLPPEQILAENILELQVKTPIGGKKKMIKKYEEAAGVSKATAYRHLRKVKKGESPADKKYRNAIKPVISGDLELQIRQMWYADKTQGYIKIYKRLGSPKRPSFDAVKEFMRKLKKEDMLGRLAAKEGK